MATCSRCGETVENVRDDYTGALFPVDPEPIEVTGFRLLPPGEGERARRAVLIDVEVHQPHEQTCTAGPVAATGEHEEPAE